MPEATPREKELIEQLARSTAENARLAEAQAWLMEDQERLRTETEREAGSGATAAHAAGV